MRILRCQTHVAHTHTRLACSLPFGSQTQRFCNTCLWSALSSSHPRPSASLFSAFAHMPMDRAAVLGVGGVGREARAAQLCAQVHSVVVALCGLAAHRALAAENVSFVASTSPNEFLEARMGGTTSPAKVYKGKYIILNRHTHNKTTRPREGTHTRPKPVPRG